MYDDIVQVLVVFSAPLILLSLLFFFTKETVFRAWAKFAKIYLSVAAVLIFLSTFSNQGGGWIGVGFDTELTTWWLAGLFLIISLFLIAIKSWKLRGTVIEHA